MIATSSGLASAHWRSMSRSPRSLILRIGSPTVGKGFASDDLSGHDHLHDLRGPVAEFQAHHVTHATIVLKFRALSGPSREEQAVVNRFVRFTDAEPLHHRRFFGVRLSGVLGPQH